MPSIDFNAADHRQRKSLRVVLTKVFGSERALEMFLDEELGMKLQDEVEKGPLKERVYELIGLLAKRGRLDPFMQALLASDDYREAPDLRDLILTWSSMSVPTQAQDTDDGRRAATSAKEKPPADAAGGTASNVAKTAPEAIERILDGKVSRIRPLAWLSELAATRRRVCLLRDRAGSHALGTGFLIAPDLVLTAGHVVRSHQEGANQQFEAVFDYGIGSGRRGAARSIPVKSTRILLPEELSAGGNYVTETLGSLHYALLVLDDKPGNERLEDGTLRGWFDPTQQRERLREGEELLLLHHPHGGEMALSEGTVGPTPEAADRLQHDCMTVGGSSGAPVIDAAMRWVGVHERKLSGSQGNRQQNLAVRADRIARDLQQRGVALEPPPERGTPELPPRTP